MLLCINITKVIKATSHQKKKKKESKDKIDIIYNVRVMYPW